MSNDQNPYQTPELAPPNGQLSSASLSFGDALSRGMGAANKTLVGAVLIFMIIGPIQIISSLSAAMVVQGDVFQPPAAGQSPPPELFLMMGYGCFSCFWFFVAMFALPWTGGGIYGQLNDRLTGKAVGSFLQYGKEFYVRFLLLMLMYIGVVILLFIPMWGVGAFLSVSELQPGVYDPEKMRELGRHPLNVGAGILFALANIAIGTVMVLVQSTLVVNNCRTMESISGAFSFIGRHFADAVRLFVVFTLMSIPIMLLQQVANFLPMVTAGIMAAIGGISAIYLAYVSVLNAGIGASVYVARRPVEVASD